uniref:Salivary lipocalin n=1 Tax=Ornithodoros parkeri TaxID=140564 RepID=A6N9S0_ORNPR|nr:salivary lipocalin [Ornithodoros parkeri]
MECKLAVVVFCTFVVGFADAATTTYDVWKVLSGNEEFFMLNRTYVRPPGGNECAYMKRKSKDDSKHELTTQMGYRKNDTKEFRSGTYTVTASQGEGESVYSEMTVKGGQLPGTGVKYRLVFSNGDGCNVLQVKGGGLDGHCELWAPVSQAPAQATQCSNSMPESCGSIQESPYKGDCKIPTASS